MKLPLASERNLGNLGNLFLTQIANLGNLLASERILEMVSDFVGNWFPLISTFNFQLCFGFLLEAVAVDDEAFVCAFADEAALVVGADAEHEAAAVDFCQLAVAPHAHPDGRGGAVADVDAGAHGALTGVE